jgi:GntR family transcriptional repressor for pyruvate dehydrogenase complex
MTSFSVVSKSSKHEIVAAALEEAILRGDLKIGEKLPSEQSLAAQFGVSRNILREALRDVKARGLLDVRNGDGSYIASPALTDLGDMLNRFIVLSDTAIEHYYEIRLALEVKACELAAIRATPEDIENLEALCGKIEKNLEFKEELTRLDFEFHLSVNRITQNPLFGCLLQPLKNLMIYMFDCAYSQAAAEEALYGHKLIIDALRARDSELARAAMTRHIEFSESNLASIMRRSKDPQPETGTLGSGAPVL